ncbi:MAG TPA: OsmC family protein [Candidatus Dormibacteraeota bacterium]|nr:OsmC family protein [Candidatus Dormibacteraeota bacterium]
MSHRAQIRTYAGGHGSTAAEPASIVVRHHRTDQVELEVDRLTGGHLLHLALAGCVFNNVLRMAAENGIQVAEVSVTVDGDFTAAGESTGITCHVDVAADVPQEEIDALARRAFDDSTVASVLRRGAQVEFSPAG